ncbi:MAG TPA: hypothetical protein PK413_14655, partial [Thermoanaerobaculia bacterium]|nr:hypothetical protein [Thermoanaerobaculia bacterium]
PSPTVASASPPPPPAPERGFAAGSIRSQKDGTCPECKAGEWSVSAQVATGPAGRAADCALAAPFKNRLAGIAAEGSPAFGRFVGPLVDPVSGRWVAIAGGGEPLSPPGTSCQLLAVVLPKGARYKGYVYEVGEAGRNGSCVADGECEVGKAHWSGHPGIEKVGDATVIWGLFTNLSSDRERRAKLVVYFSHPDPGWKPPAL